MNIQQETENDLEVLKKFNREKTIAELIKTVEKVLTELNKTEVKENEN